MQSFILTKVFCSCGITFNLWFSRCDEGKFVCPGCKAKYSIGFFVDRSECEGGMKNGEA